MTVDFGVRRETCWEGESLHERIIDGDDKDLTSGFQFGAVDVAGYVGCGARRTWYSVSIVFGGALCAKRMRDACEVHIK